MVKALALAIFAGFFASVLSTPVTTTTTKTTTTKTTKTTTTKPTTTKTTKTTTSTTTSAAPAGQTQWGQCGGIGWTGYTVCQPPATCVYLNAYHSQCLVETTTTTDPATTTTTTTSTTSASSVAQAAHWAQCGGIYWTGPTVCAPPYTCTYLNDYHYQCL